MENEEKDESSRGPLASAMAGAVSVGADMLGESLQS